MRWLAGWVLKVVGVIVGIVLAAEIIRPALPLVVAIGVVAGLVWLLAGRSAREADRYTR